MDSLQLLPLRNCGSCQHWERTAPCGTSGVVECPCALDQHGHEREMNKDWMVGSDRCGKWERA